MCSGLKNTYHDYRSECDGEQRARREPHRCYGAVARRASRRLKNDETPACRTREDGRPPLSRDKLPYSILFIARAGDDYAAIHAARCYQSLTAWHLQRPALSHL